MEVYLGLDLCRSPHVCGRFNECIENRAPKKEKKESGRGGHALKTNEETKNKIKDKRKEKNKKKMKMNQ